LQEGTSLQTREQTWINTFGEFSGHVHCSQRMLKARNVPPPDKPIWRFAIDKSASISVARGNQLWFVPLFLQLTYFPVW